MTVAPIRQPIAWTLDPGNPVIRPGQLHGAAHVLRLADRYRMYYWATGDDGNRICLAESPLDAPNAWEPRGSILEPQPETAYNCSGPSFPHVVPAEDGGPWLLYFCGWGKPDAAGKRLHNTTGLAISEDGGISWRYWSDRPVLACDRPWDREATGSVWVLREGGLLRMYYTAIGHYFPKPAGVRTGHGDVIPRIGVGYAVSRDGLTWEKPVDDLLIAPRGFDTEPYEYIASKPCIIREEGGYRMWVHTFGHAYRVRSLVSADGLAWQWTASGADGDLGVGKPGAFDDCQRSYVSVVREGNEYRCWYTGNAFGGTGMGYAVGRRTGQREWRDV